MRYGEDEVERTKMIFEAATKAAEERIEKRIRELETKNARPGLAVDPRGLDVLGDRSEHSKAYDRFLRQGNTEDLSELEAKGMSVGSDPEGGYGVPQDLDLEILKWEKNATPFRQIANVLPVSNELYEKLVRQGSAGAGWVDETEARPETTTPTLASIKPYFGEVYANPAVTQKLLDDARFDVAAFLGEEVGETFAEFENTAFIVGNGVKRPKGILSYPLAANPTFGQVKQVKSGLAGQLSADKLIEVSLSIKPKYRTNAVWLMSTATVLLVRQLKNATTNDYLWRPGLEQGKPNTLLGHPIVECEDMPAPAADSNAIAFGDFRRAYKIADVKNTRILRDPYTNKPKVHFYTTKRLGGGVEDFSAYVVHTLGV